jgi:hypothetical protein
VEDRAEEQMSVLTEQLEPDAGEQVQQRWIRVVVPQRFQQPVLQQLRIDELHESRQRRRIEPHTQPRVQRP